MQLSLNNNINFGLARKPKHAPRSVNEACKYMYGIVCRVGLPTKSLVGETVTRDGTVARIFIEPNGSHYVEPPRYHGEVIRKFYSTVAGSLSKGKIEK